MSGSETDIQWFIARDGKQHGPVSDVELRKLVELSHLKPGDLVWRQGFSDWRTAASVFPNIAEAAAPKPAPAATPAPAPTPVPATVPAPAPTPAPAASTTQPAASTASPAPAPVAHPMAPGASSKFGASAMAGAAAQSSPASPQNAPFTPSAAQPGPPSPSTDSWRPHSADARPDQMATRPLGNPPIRTAGPFPAPGPAPHQPDARNKPTEMMAPQRYHQQEAPPRSGRKKALVAVGLIAMASAGAWFASQHKEELLGFMESGSGSAENSSATTATANVIPPSGVGAPPASPAETAALASTPEDVDKKLQGRHMWVAVKQEFPDWYQTRIAEVARLSAERKDQAEISRYLISEFVTLRRENAKHALAASTTRHKEMAAAFLANLRQLSTESGDGCYDFISKGESSATIVARMDDPAKSAELEAQVVAIVGAIVEGRNQPAQHAPPVKTDYDVLAGELGRLGWTQADMQLFANPKELAKAPRERVCNMLKDWFTAHLAIQDPNTQERLLFETLKPVVSG